MTARGGARVLIDAGSTNMRAWLVDDRGIRERRTAPIGVKASAVSGSTDEVRRAAGALIAALDPGGGARVAAAGMITSSLGVADVPHVDAPAGAADLARAAIEWPGDGLVRRPMLLVPGVRTPGDGAPASGDVMRGEETLVIGLVADGLLAPGEVLLNAGSHWKMIAVDAAGRIAHSRTSLGGEVVHALKAATLLSASLPEGPLAAHEPGWLEAGAAAAVCEGLLRAFFGARLLDQQHAATAAQRHAWIAGACIADDLRGLALSGALERGARVAVSGPAAVAQAWAHLLARDGFAARVIDPPQMERGFVAGLIAIAARRGW